MRHLGRSYGVESLVFGEGSYAHGPFEEDSSEESLFEKNPSEECQPEEGSFEEVPFEEYSSGEDPSEKGSFEEDPFAEGQSAEAPCSTETQLPHTSELLSEEKSSV